MKALIKKRYTTGNLKSSILQLPESDNFILLRNFKSEKISDFLLNFFSGYGNEIYTTLVIEKISINENPSYFYEIPEIHPAAKIVDIEQALKMDSSKSEFIAIDLRAKEFAQKQPLKFESKIIHRYGASKQSDFYAQLNALDQKNPYAHLTFSKKKQLLLVGQDAFDLTPYNYANALMTEGYSNIYILKNGAANFKYPVSKIPQPKIKNINWSDLQSLINRPAKERNLIFADCRTKKEYARATIEDANLESFITEYPKNHTVIFFGRNRADERILNCIESAKKKNHGSHFYYYADGIMDWHFKQKFVKADISEKTKALSPGLNKRASAPSQTERVKRAGADPQNKVRPEQEKGAGAIEPEIQ